MQKCNNTDWERVEIFIDKTSSVQRKQKNNKDFEATRRKNKYSDRNLMPCDKLTPAGNA